MNPNNSLGKIKFLIDQGYIKPGMEIMEVGAGNTLVQQYLSEEYNIDIICTDLNPSPGIVRFDIESDTLPYKFDLVFGLGVLHHLYRPKRALKRLKMMSKKVVFIEPTPKSLIHWLIMLKPIEWTRLLFFMSGLKGEIYNFESQAYNVKVPQQVITNDS